MTEKNIEEMNSAELKAELEGRPDLGNILRGDPVNVPAGEQENKTDEPAETTTNEGSADTSQVTPPKEETPEEVQDKKSKFEKYAEKKNRELQEKDEVITTKEERIKELEAQLKEKEESEDFESIEEKENAINEIKNDLHYEKNRTSELKSEKSALEKRKLDGLMDTMDIIPDEQSKIREMRKNPTYANLPAEDLIALYSAKNGGIQFDQQEVNKKSGDPSLLGDDKVSGSETIDVNAMDTKQLKSLLESKLKQGDNSFLH